MSEWVGGLIVVPSRYAHARRKLADRVDGRVVAPPIMTRIPRAPNFEPHPPCRPGFAGRGMKRPPALIEPLAILRIGVIMVTVMFAITRLDITWL
jgi:hypothetical protein